MTTSTFDSLAAMRGLEAAGVNRNQAEAHAEQLRAAAGADLEQLANKDDLKRVETTLTAEMRIVKWAMARTSRNSPSPRAPPPRAPRNSHGRLPEAPCGLVDASADADRPEPLRGRVDGPWTALGRRPPPPHTLGPRDHRAHRTNDDFFKSARRGVRFAHSRLERGRCPRTPAGQGAVI